MEKCLNCGRNIDEGLSICPYCGNSIPTVERGGEDERMNISDGEDRTLQNDPDINDFKNADAEFMFQSSQDITSNKPSAPPVIDSKVDKKKKSVLLLGGIIIAFAIFLAVILLTAGRKEAAVSEYGTEVFTDTEGNAYSFNEKGKVIKIEGEWSGGYSTGDRKHIVLTDVDQNLYCFDGKGDNGVQVRSEDGRLLTIRNNGFIYTTDSDSAGEDSDTAYRYFFDTEERTKIGSDIDCTANNSLDALIYKDQGIYILPDNADEPVKVAGCEEESEVKLVGISDTGKMAVWTEEKGSKTTLYVSENNEKIKIGDLELTNKGFDYTYACFINKDSEVIVGNGSSKQMFRKKFGEECVEARVIGETDLFGIYSEQGAIYRGQNDHVKGLYVICAGEEEYLSNLYYIDERGEREKIISDIQVIVGIHKGKVVYIDEDDSLFIADLGTKELKNIQKISSEVYTAQVSKNGEYIYYGKDSDDYETYTLYECKAGKKLDSVKISDDVYKMWISEDGKQVAYLKDPTSIEEMYTKYGELYVKKFGKEPKKVSSDMISIFGNDGYISKDNWNCFKYEDKEKKNIIGRILHFDGKEVELEATDILYDYSFEF